MKGLTVLFLLFVVGCSDDATPTPDAGTTQDAGVDTTTDSAVDTSTDTVDNDATTGTLFGSVCNYTNNFSMGPECRSYFGDWNDENATADCDSVTGTLSVGTCETASLLGNCDVPADAGLVTWHLYGEESACGFAKLGCSFATDGVYRPSEVCDGNTTQPMTGVFIPPVEICTEPIAGEPAGTSENGEVCTWQIISGATEEGRRFEDYASCDVVRTQRPAYAAPRPDDAEKADARLSDPVYKAELDWVKEQIQASACVCCHASTLTPDGVSNFDIDQPGNFMNGFYDSGLALGANWINSEALGAFPAEENNGFDRINSGIPSTNPLRMRTFFQNELGFRGLAEADFVDAAPFGGPLYDQIYYEPTACTNGEGVNAGGILNWVGGAARYVYVLEAGSKSPTIPPNLDKPVGTLWRIDVDPADEGLASGTVTYGTATGATQKIPEAGQPAALTSGTEYYIYAAADVGIPLTRCLFTAP